MSNEQPFYLTQNTGLGVATPADDLLHPEQNRGITADSLTETQYFGFSIPEERIHGMGYLWHRPNLGIVTGGIWAWQGVKTMTVASELFDIRGFMNDSALANDLHEYQLENSYGVRVIEPLKRHHMRYEDAARGNRVDLEYSAVTPAVMFGDGRHFEQSMRVRGELTMRGKTHRVDGYTIRDRSWGKPRPELPMGMPPLSWMTCTFNDDFAINVNITDHVGSNAQASGAFAVPVERALNGGWVYRNGRVTRIVSGHKQIERDPQTLVPRKIIVDVVDEAGQALRMSGSLLASCPWSTWPNVAMMISLMRWECEGLVGHGDCQEAMWSDYVNAHLQPSFKL